jgi:hypothetical protein
MARKSTESLSDDSPDFRIIILQEMRRQGIEENIHEIVRESYEASLDNLSSPLLLSHAERQRLRRLVQNDLLAGMITKD